MTPGEPETGHDPTVVAALAEGRLDREERARVLEHLAACRPCREVFATLAREGEGVAAHRPAAGFGATASRAWLPLAATIVLATGSALWVLRRAPAIAPPQVTASMRPVTASPEVRASATPPPVAVSPSKAPPDAMRSAAPRRVAGKTFRLVAGEWIDTSFDPLATLTAVDVTTPAEREAALAREPRLRPYAALGPRVTVVLDGAVYRFGPPATR
jgi:hypothetical protein